MVISNIINLTKKEEKKAQAGVEYLILIGFVTFGILSILVISYIYLGSIGDKIAMNQIEVLADKIISSSESVFYAGNPSKTTITIYVPKNVDLIQFQDNNLIIELSTSSGKNVRAFKSNVLIIGDVSTTEGTKRLTIEAFENFVRVS